MFKSSRPLLMGVINTTPDSFSDGGAYHGVTQGLKLVRDGADFIDVGGESTRPGASPVALEEELARVMPVISALCAQITVPVSIDTTKSQVAAAALAAGCRIVNDVWGLQHDPDMARVVAEHDAGVVIMHNRESVDPARDIVPQIHDFFAHSLDLADRAGIDPDLIALDPGIGFGKNFEQNLEVLHQLDAFLCYGKPLLVGASRKSFIGRISDEPHPASRVSGSVAAHLFALHKGARVLRVHDVAEHRQALAVWKALESAA